MPELCGLGWDKCCPINRIIKSSSLLTSSDMTEANYGWAMREVQSIEKPQKSVLSEAL